jgi:hypothetical protein
LRRARLGESATQPIRRDPAAGRQYTGQSCSLEPEPSERACWRKVFPDKAMMFAVIDRLVHHAIIFEMNVESRRWEEALERQQKGGWPVTRAEKKKD